MKAHLIAIFAQLDLRSGSTELETNQRKAHDPILYAFEEADIFIYLDETTLMDILTNRILQEL
jgi:hypothetical protein